MLEDTFGGNANYKIFGDFKSIDEVEEPNFYIHLVEKADWYFMCGTKIKILHVKETLNVVL